jgi:excinuclease ABC subunit A
MTSDYVIDLGPGAGVEGGRLVAAGTPKQIMRDKKSLTGQYLSGRKKIPVPETRRRGNGRYLRLYGARCHNLKGIDVSIPLGTLTCVTGVSGSGKSSLINETLAPALERVIYNSKHKPGEYKRLEGVEHIDKVIILDQSPIGRTPRSNPATYTSLFAPIRDLYASLPEAKARGYQPGRFSFNVRGGRCEACEGAGVIKIEMHFLPDVYVTCDQCKGRRYNDETLEVRYKGKSISDVLNMTVAEAEEFFKNIPAINHKLRLLSDVGLDYIKLGQPATTLSGGEAQRIKICLELGKRGTGSTLYLLDEPTTGLHFEDIGKLLSVLSRLVDAGNTVVVIEHNLDVVKTADHIIDLGPDGGEYGGQVVAAGKPEDVAKNPKSYTGQYLKKILNT